MFDCCMRFDGFGVKKLRIEEQLFITLSKICEYTYWLFIFVSSGKKNDGYSLIGK